MTSTNSLKSVMLTVLLTAFLVSCGGSKPMVDDVKVSTTQVDNDIWLNMQADLGIGNVQLPVVTLPILLPKNGKEIGTLSLGMSLEGQNQINVDINVSETANLDLHSVTLPNGTQVPLIGQNPVIAVPIGKGAEVYISVSADSAAIGLSIPIKSFDSIGSKIGTTAIMPYFNKNGVLGSAGIYTSKNAGENGFALVADVSSLLGKHVASNVVEDHALRMPQLEQSDKAISERIFKAPTRSQKRRLDRELYKMHKKRKKLELH